MLSMEPCHYMCNVLNICCTEQWIVWLKCWVLHNALLGVKCRVWNSELLLWFAQGLVNGAVNCCCKVLKAWFMEQWIVAVVCSRLGLWNSELLLWSAQGLVYGKVNCDLLKAWFMEQWIVAVKCTRLGLCNSELLLLICSRPDLWSSELLLWSAQGLVYGPVNCWIKLLSLKQCVVSCPVMSVTQRQNGLFQDEHIAVEKATFSITGGCCTLVALFMCGKLYIANAGDCRYHRHSLNAFFLLVKMSF